MQKTLEELKFVQKQREVDFGETKPELCGKVLALCLSSRKNMCVHPEVMVQEDRNTVDSVCREMTSPWNRMRAQSEQTLDLAQQPASDASAGSPAIKETVKLCSFFENYYENREQFVIPADVYTLEDLKEFG